MDNDKMNTSSDALGADNADILAEKRRRANAASSMNKIPSARIEEVPRARMHAEKPAEDRAGARPPIPPAVDAAKPVSDTAASENEAIPLTSARAAAKKQSAVPNPAQMAPEKKSHPGGSPASKPGAASGEKKSPAGIHSMIPHQQAEIVSRKNEPAGATRVTDVRDLRKITHAEDATRLSDARPVVPKKKKKKNKEDESEGKNAVVSVVKAITYIVSVLVVSVFLAIFIILVGNDVFAFVKDDTVIEVTIPPYATLNDVSEILHENGLIEYPTIFKIYANLKMSDKEKENGIEFIAGTYSVSPMYNYEEFLAEFKEKPVVGTSRITIPEGYTTDQIIDLFVSKGIGTREGYINVINNYDFDYWFIDELEENSWKDGRYYRLDGYLFPDTYEFYNDSSEEVVINKLLRRFNQIFVESFSIRADDLGYSVDEILTLASIIEKEGGRQSDFFNISSVFHNRLKAPVRYPYLESDATIVYAIRHDTGEHINPTKEDLKYESPYNTHTNKGLPPGPIANPSASAIRAALYPTSTNYYYFYSVSSSVTLFASTLDEHLANVAKGSSGTAEPQE